MKLVLSKEDQIRCILDSLTDEGKLFKIKLYPPAWSNIIEKEDNRMEINNGEDGVFEGISESFYDEMVRNYYDNNQNN